MGIILHKEKLEAFMKLGLSSIRHSPAGLTLVFDKLVMFELDSFCNKTEVKEREGTLTVLCKDITYNFTLGDSPSTMIGINDDEVLKRKLKSFNFEDSPLSSWVKYKDELKHLSDPRVLEEYKTHLYGGLR